MIADATPVRSEPQAQWTIRGYSQASRTRTNVLSWSRDIQMHEDSEKSTCVTPAARVAAASSRYQDSSGLEPLRFSTVLIWRS